MSIEFSIREKVSQEFQPEYIELENESHGHNVPRGSETHFRLVLVSPSFEGQSRVERQRRVQNLLDTERAQGLHALTMRLMTPAEWEKVKDTFEMPPPACHGGSKRL